MTRLPTGASRWQQAKRVLEGAMELPPTELDGYLDTACDGDPSLRRDVESLLVHAESEDFLENGLAPGVVESFDLIETVSLEGHRLGPWRLDKRIGEGGMGAVYLAERADGEYTQRVAVKVVRHRVASESALRRFRAERQILADLDHPNIARLIDAGTTEGGLPYLVMEYVEGEPIDVYCDKRSLTIERRLQLFRQVCAAVQAAHAHHVVHRDLKPANVLIAVDGAPKLLDFGIAKLLAPELLDHSIEVTATFQRLMTPAFASPEQIRGETITPAADVYSLGVILYALVCGHSPYDGKTETASMERLVCDLEPPAPSAALRSLTSTVGAQGEDVALTAAAVGAARGTDPDALAAQLKAGIDALVLEALAKQPAERYATAADLSDAIDAHMRPDPRGTPAMAPAQPARPVPREAPGHEDEATSPPPLFAWGHLQVIRRAGEGVFGEVYECRDPSLDTTVALKLFRQPVDADVDASGQMLARRILKEGQLLARVRHRNVVLVHGVGVHDGTVGMWMEYLDGRNLQELLQVQGRFSAREACLVGIELCSALAAVHGRGVVHRDIKAQNVIRAEGGRIVLTDFGSGGDLVGEATSGDRGAAGTPLYMAPEVLRGGAATVQSDIYSLGVLLFRLVTGAFPVEAGSWSDLIAKLERGEIELVRDRRPELRPGVAQVIQTALSIDPQERFASAGKMQHALEVAADMTHNSPTPVVVPDNGTEDREVIRRMAQVTAAIAGGLALGLFVMFLGFATVQVYRQAMRIPPDFVTASGLGYVPFGVHALVPILILTIIAGLSLLAATAACRALLWLIERRQPVRGPLHGLAVRARALEGAVAAANPETIATVVAGVGLAAIVGITFVYLDMWRALIALMEDTTARDADLSALGLPSSLYTVFLSTVVAGMLLACAAASRLTQRIPGRRSALRLLRGAPLAVIAAAVVLMAAPWKTIYADHQPVIYLPAPPEAENDSDTHRWVYRDGERIDLNARRALIIADNGTEAWLYFPEIRKSARVGSAFVDAVGDPTPIFRHLGEPTTQ